MSTNTLEQTIVWRRLDVPGHDACGLWRVEHGWRLAGTAVFQSGQQPCHLNYEVSCDSDWHTRTALVVGWLGKTPVHLALNVLAGERWTLNEINQGKTVEGLVDVDLGFTPATNLLQLRRLSLDIGAAAESPVVYLHFPELTIGRLEHRYRRVARDQYDYQALAFDYAAILQVSDCGFVTDYPGLWKLET